MQDRYPNEPYRIWAAGLAEELTAAASGKMDERLLGLANPPLNLRSMNDLLEPLDLMHQTLKESQLQDISGDILAEIRYQALRVWLSRGPPRYSPI